MTEKRRHPRCPVSEDTHVFWTDPQGRYWQEKAKVVDMSASGLGLAMKKRVEVRTQVGLRSVIGRVTVSAYVRHIRQRGLLYITGLELPRPE
jgi:hypothetical protein